MLTSFNFAFIVFAYSLRRQPYTTLNASKMTEPAKDEKIVHGDVHNLPITVTDRNITEVKVVQNVALADAMAKQKPSLWTRRMLQVL